MCKFVELTNTKGRKFLLNTKQIVCVHKVDIQWGLDWTISSGSTEYPKSFVEVLFQEGCVENLFVTENYSEIKAAIM